MSGGEMKKRKKVVSGGSSGNAKLFVDKDAKKRYDTFIVKRPLLIECDVYLDELHNDSFMCSMNAMGMGTLNKSVGAILDVKRVKHVEQPSAVLQ
ncbi:unnamed protein product, partial [Ilex paraguariensis]